VSTHYVADFDTLRTSYILTSGLDDDAMLDAINQADATIVDPTAVLTDLFEDDLFPDANEGKAAIASLFHMSPHLPRILEKFRLGSSCS
jgi:hypothetical protein